MSQIATSGAAPRILIRQVGQWRLLDALRCVAFVATFLLAWITLEPFPDLGQLDLRNLTTGNETLTYAAFGGMTLLTAGLVLRDNLQGLRSLLVPSLMLFAAWTVISVLLSLDVSTSVRRFALTACVISTAATMMLLPKLETELVRWLTVVTLATLFMLQGAALLVLDAPGGGVAEWLKAMVVGTLPVPGLPDSVTAWIPRALILLVVLLCIVWIPLKRSQLGLSIYAIGSNQLAAFRSGVPVARTKILAYAIAGLFGAMGGLSLTMSTGIGAPIPGPYLMASVAAVVLGGVTLGGGKGGLLGPIIAVFVLRLVRTDLTLLAIDPNVTAIIEGTIMVVVVMFGAFITIRSRSS